MKKTITLFLLFAGLCMHAMAYDFISNNIYYKITGASTAKVTYASSATYNSYSGAVTIPSTVTNNGITYTVNEIDSAAFALSTGLTSVTLPNTIVRIDSSAFVMCSSLQSINIPASVRYIGSAALSGTNIRTITIPDSVQFIGGGQFYSCSSLVSITYNAINATHGRYYDEDINYPGRFSYLPNMEGCSSLTTVTIGSNVRTIPRAFFEGAPAIRSIVIPDNVTTIRDSAFYNCTSLSTMQIGSGVTQIGSNALFMCGLTSLSVRAVTPPTLGSYVFNGISNTIPVTVPCQSIRTYRATSGWNYFTNITGGSSCEVNVNVVINPTQAASPTGNGRHTIGDTVRIGAIANSGYTFIDWNDGVTANPRDIIVMSDTTFTANFSSDNAIADAEFNATIVVAGKGIITAQNVKGGEFAIYDLGGRCLLRKDVAEGSEQSFRVPAAGVYVVRNNENSVKIVVR
jgi:hypothetical protein